MKVFNLINKNQNVWKKNCRATLTEGEKVYLQLPSCLSALWLTAQIFSPDLFLPACRTKTFITYKTQLRTEDQGHGTETLSLNETSQHFTASLFTTT